MSARRTILLARARNLYALFAPLAPGTRVAGFIFEGIRWDEQIRAWRLDFRREDGEGGLALYLEVLAPGKTGRRYIEQSERLGLYHRAPKGRQAPADGAGVSRLATLCIKRVRANEGAHSPESLDSICDDLRDGAMTLFGDLAELRLTLACNEACPMCNSASGADNVVSSLARARDRLPLLRDAGVERLTLTGGEPTLVKGLPELIVEARAQGFRQVVLQTNALRFADPVFAARFDGPARPDYLLVSFHSHVEATHDAIVGLPGAFPRAIAGIRELLGRGHEVVLSHVLQRANADDVLAFVDDLASRFGPGAGERHGGHAPGASPVHPKLSLSFSVIAPSGSATIEDIPRFGPLAAKLDQAIRRARALGMTVHMSEMCGMPRCLLPDDLDALLEAQDDVQDERVKVKLPGCTGCVHDGACSGIWRDYLAAHGEAEFVPVGRPKG